jgi:hypothetical protein
LLSLLQAIASHTQCSGARYSKLFSAAAMSAPAPVETKGKKAGRDSASAARSSAAATPRLEDVIDINVEFDRAVEGLGAAVDESAWRWTRQTLLPFVKSSIESASKAAQQGAPVRSHKQLAVNYCDAIHALQATLNGISALSLDAKAKETTSKHALKCLGGNVLNVMVQALADPVLVSSLAPTAPTGEPSAMTAEIRTKILLKTSADGLDEVDAANKCAPRLLFVQHFASFFKRLFIWFVNMPSLTRILRAIAKGVVADALQAIESAAQALEFRSRPLDAKAERVVLQRVKDEMHKELSLCDGSDINNALILGTCLAAAKFRRCGSAHLFRFRRNCLYRRHRL